MILRNTKLHFSQYDFNCGWNIDFLNTCPVSIIAYYEMGETKYMKTLP